LALRSWCAGVFREGSDRGRGPESSPAWNGLRGPPKHVWRGGAGGLTQAEDEGLCRVSGSRRVGSSVTFLRSIRSLARFLRAP
jgi:hypothetical protein